MVAIEPLFIVALVGVMVFDIRGYLFGILALNVVAFFVITLVCHGELSRSRPAARHLTAFYMWMSAGGVIGGIFAGLIAPNVFSWVLEYPALIVLAILCRPGLEMPTDTAHAAALGRRRRGRRDRGVSRPRPSATSPTRRRSTGPSARMLVVAGSRVARAAAVRRRDRGRVHHRHRPTGPTAKCARRCAASSACTRSPRPPTATSACSCTAPRSTAPNGCATMPASRSPASRR